MCVISDINANIISQDVPAYMVHENLVTIPFLARHNNLGIVQINLSNHLRPITTLHIAIKNSMGNQIGQTRVLNLKDLHSLNYPYGFPKIINSKNNWYTIEIYAYQPDHFNLHDLFTNPIVTAKYEYSRAELLQPPNALNLVKTKVQYSIRNHPLYLVLAFIPIVLYWIISITKHVLLVCVDNLNQLYYYCLITILLVALSGYINSTLVIATWILITAIMNKFLSYNTIIVFNLMLITCSIILYLFGMDIYSDKFAMFYVFLSIFLIFKVIPKSDEQN